MEIQHVQDALRSIENTEVIVDRNSQNNGTVPLVWGVVVLIGLSGFDVFSALAARWYGPENARAYGPFMAAGFLMPVILGAALWTGRYIRRLPVTPRVLRNRWLFVKDGRKVPILLGSGWWAFYHIGVVFGGIGIGLWLAERFHRQCLPPFTFTLIGLADAAPLLLTGWTQWRDVRRREAQA